MHFRFISTIFDFQLTLMSCAYVLSCTFVLRYTLYFELTSNFLHHEM